MRLHALAVKEEKPVRLCVVVIKAKKPVRLHALAVREEATVRLRVRCGSICARGRTQAEGGGTHSLSPEKGVGSGMAGGCAHVGRGLPAQVLRSPSPPGQGWCRVHPTRARGQTALLTLPRGCSSSCCCRWCGCGGGVHVCVCAFLHANVTVPLASRLAANAPSMRAAGSRRACASNRTPGRRLARWRSWSGSAPRPSWATSCPRSECPCAASWSYSSAQGG